MICVSTRSRTESLVRTYRRPRLASGPECRLRREEERIRELLSRQWICHSIGESGRDFGIIPDHLTAHSVIVTPTHRGAMNERVAWYRNRAISITITKIIYACAATGAGRATFITILYTSCTQDVTDKVRISARREYAECIFVVRLSCLISTEPVSECGESITVSMEEVLAKTGSLVSFEQVIHYARIMGCPEGR